MDSRYIPAYLLAVFYWWTCLYISVPLPNSLTNHGYIISCLARDTFPINIYPTLECLVQPSLSMNSVLTSTPICPAWLSKYWTLVSVTESLVLESSVLELPVSACLVLETPVLEPLISVYPVLKTLVSVYPMSVYPVSETPALESPISVCPVLLFSVSEHLTSKLELHSVCSALKLVHSTSVLLNYVSELETVYLKSILIFKDLSYLVSISINLSYSKLANSVGLLAKYVYHLTKPAIYVHDYI